MKVLKFGGSSVKNAENILKVKDILSSQFEGKGAYTVVVSALGGITDQLIEMSTLASKGSESYKEVLADFRKRHIDTALALLGTEGFDALKQELDENHDTLEDLLKGIFLVREASPRTMDYVLSFGERNSAYIIAKAFTQRGIECAYLDARKIIETNKKFGNATVNFKATDSKIKAYYEANQGPVHIVTGFISADAGGLTTTLGRGGSDYTAAILAGGLQAEVLEIWTDVDGVLTTDPRKVKKTFTVPHLSYREAMELSHFGAKVIYAPTIQPALKKSIPIYIKNTFNPTFEGTLIDSQVSEDNKNEITGLSSLSGLALMRLAGSGLVGIPGVAARLFSCLAAKDINIVLITQGSSEYAICFAIKNEDAKLSKSTIEEEFKKELAEGQVNEVLVEKDLSIIAIVSERMRNQPGVAGKLFASLGKEGINIVAIAQGSSELNISFAVSSKDEVKALNLIHDSFFLSQTKDIHLFMVGVGLIGGTLLKQLEAHVAQVQASQNINIKLVGLSNSKTMLIEPNGITYSTWSEDLKGSSSKADAKAFVEQMIALNLPNSIFLDNTATDVIPRLYKQVLSANISISTPNKVATSAPYEQYLELKSIAKKKKAAFLYETNVGAGLPVISTIENLRSSGDTITSLEAVLSGSISYIFNNFSAERKFSEVVMEAKTIGLTEPDPRDDLSGSDVKRKITILAREAGYVVDMADVSLTPILNTACLSAKTVHDFFVELRKMDAYFADLADKASQNKQKLRFIASMENGKCSIQLKAVGEESPFYNLGGSDNMLVMHTERYAVRPLVIKGPGAGADVTAAGVFAEIITIANKT